MIDPQPRIVGWRPTGRAIVAVGIGLAIVFAGIGLMLARPATWLLSQQASLAVVVVLVIVAVAAAAARLIMVGLPTSSQPSATTVTFVLIKLTNMIAFVLLATLALIAWLAGSTLLDGLVQAAILCALFAVLLSLTGSIAANVDAVRTRRVSSPPAV